MEGTGCSVAAFVAMQAGIPLKAPLRNYGEQETFLPGVITLNDILKTQGIQHNFHLWF